MWAATRILHGISHAISPCFPGCNLFSSGGGDSVDVATPIFITPSHPSQTPSMHVGSHNNASNVVVFFLCASSFLVIFRRVQVGTGERGTATVSKKQHAMSKNVFRRHMLSSSCHIWNTEK